MMVETRRRGPRLIRGLAPTRYRDKRYQRSQRTLSYLSSDLISIEFRHADVEHRDLWSKRVDRSDGLPSIMNNSDIVPIHS